MFRLDRLFFSYDKVNVIQIMIKALYFVFLIMLWLFLFHVVRQIRKGNDDYRRGAIYFGIYFPATMAIMVFIWPGTWFWDDVITLQTISTYQLDAWHHVLTGVYQAILLQLLPFPAGMIILQNFIISICVARVLINLEKCFWICKSKNPIVWILKFLPFLLPPVLAYQYSGFRLGIYSYLELLFITEFVTVVRRKKIWSLKYGLFISIICILTAAWRTESVFYVPITGLVILLLDKALISTKKKIGFVLLILFGFSSLFLWQKQALKNDDYVLVSFANPCTELVRMSDPIADHEELKKIGVIFDLEIIHQNPSKTGEKMFWIEGFVKSGYSKQEYRDFLKAIATLSLKYPKVFWVERWNTFLRSVEISEKTNTNLYDAFDEFLQNEMIKQAKTKNWISFTPIFEKERKALINIWRGKNFKGVILPRYMRIVWNAVIPILLLCYAWMKTLQKKKFLLFLILSALMIKLPVIFLMEPEGYFLYFLSFYLIGYVYGCFKLISIITCNMNRNVVK